MSVTVAPRRVIASLVALLLVISGVQLLAPPAHAAINVTGVNPSAALTNTQVALTVSGSGITATDQARIRHKTIPGETINGIRRPGQTSSTSFISDFNLNLAAVGDYFVEVSSSPAFDPISTVPCSCTFSVSSPVEPTVTSVGPDGSTPGELVIGGTNFTRGVKVEFLLPGTSTVDPGLSFTADTVTTSTRITGTYTKTAAATPGVHDVRVSNGQTSGVCAGCFVQPVVSGASPAALGAGAQNEPLTITGAGLTGSRVSFSGNGITINGPQSASEDAVNLNVSIASNASSGARSVTATHPSGGFFTRDNTFTVNAAPTLTGTVTVGQGAQNRVVEVTGSGFQNGSQFAIGGTGVDIVSATRRSDTRYELVLNVAQNAATGARSITVVNPDKGAATDNDGVDITPGPRLNRISPVALERGQTGQTVNVYGDNFHSSMSVSFGPDTTVIGQPSVTDGGTTGEDTLTAIVNVGPAAAGGFRSVSITNADDGGSFLCAVPGCFGINTFRISGGSAVSNTVTTQQSMTFTKADGFPSSPSVVFYNNSGNTPGASAIEGTVTNQTPTTLTVTGLFTSAASGRWNVKVGADDYCVRCLNVQGLAPTVSTVVPGEGARGAQDLLVTVNGTNLADGGRIEFLRGNAPATDVTVQNNSFTVLGPDKVQVRINIAPTADTTLNDLTVRYNDGNDTSPQTATCPVATGRVGCFRLVEPPTISGVTGSTSRGQGAPAATITITGSRFEPGMTVDLGAGVTVSNVQVPSATQATASVTVADDAATGARTLTIRKDDGGVATRPNSFTVTARPTISSVSPALLKPGQATRLTIDGANFSSTAPGRIVDLGPDISVTNVQYVSASRLTADVAVASSAQLGLRNVAVTNADGGRGVAEDALRIANVPSQPGAVTGTVGDGKVRLSWTAPASTNGSPLTGYVVRCFGTTSCSTTVVPANQTSTDVLGLTNGTTYKFRVTARNDVGESAPSDSGALTPLGPEGGFVGVTPYRILDTRAPGGGGKFGQGTERDLQVAGTGPNGTVSVPTTGVSAVALNITAVKGSTRSNLRVWPADETRPFVAAVDFRAGEVVPNLTKVKLGDSGTDTGKVTLYNHAGTVDVVVDVVGYFEDGKARPDSGATYTGINPKRFFDSRTTEWGNAKASLTPGSVTPLAVADAAEIPDDATSVIVNLTVAKPTTSGYITLYPGDEANRPEPASSINFVTNQVVANLAVVKLGDLGNGKRGIKAYASMGPGHTVEMIVDLVGYYRAGTAGSKFKGITPARIVNTTAKPALGGVRLQKGQIGTYQVLGVGGVPGLEANVKAVVVSVQAALPQTPGYLRVWPSTEGEPSTSLVNFPTGRTTTNLIAVKVGTDGKIKIRNGSSGATDIVVDVMGYYI
jgi:hypothetical protein